MKQGKKILCIICLMLMSVFVGVSQNHKFMNLDTASRFIECDVHALVGVSVFAQDYQKHVPMMSEVSSSPGCGWGIGATVRFALKDYLAIGTQLDVLALNNKYSMIMVDPNNHSQISAIVTNQSYCISIPVFASLRFNIDENVKWNIDLGCYYNFGIGGTQKGDTYTTFKNNIGQVVTEYKHYKWDYYNEKHPLIHGIDDIDFGFIIGTGILVYNHYKVGVEARICTKNATTDEGTIRPNVKSHLLAMKIGYQF
ncbi:MAG: PorT family protein [Bacteroidales bacterium]|nr:PorT family protein [Bacteroidales bacterium]